MARFPLPKAILWGGLICGTLDITAAFIDVHLGRGMNPMRLLQVVAGALLGPAALEGGVATAALGLAMHFTVAFSATTIFYLLSRRFPALVEWFIPSGQVYGAVVFYVMSRVVIPVTIALKSLYLTSFNHKLPPLRWSQFLITCFASGCPSQRRCDSRAGRRGPHLCRGARSKLARAAHPGATR